MALINVSPSSNTTLYSNANIKESGYTMDFKRKWVAAEKSENNGVCSRVLSDVEEMGGAKMKLRLSNEQSSLLEEKLKQKQVPRTCKSIHVIYLLLSLLSFVIRLSVLLSWFGRSNEILGILGIMIWAAVTKSMEIFLWYRFTEPMVVAMEYLCLGVPSHIPSRLGLFF